MFGIGVTELLIILVIVVIIFGANKLPQIGGGLGKAIQNFRRATKGEDEIDVTPAAKASGEKESIAQKSGSQSATEEK